LFLGPKHARYERRTWFVVTTAVMMVFEIVAGTCSSDGAAGRRLAHGDPCRGAGTPRCLSLARGRQPTRISPSARVNSAISPPFASAVMLALTGPDRFESAERLVRLKPTPMARRLRWPCSALPSISPRLAVAREPRRPPSLWPRSFAFTQPSHRDNNLRAAYIHVVADAAIAALVAGDGCAMGSDPAVGIIGAVVIASCTGD
jgi:Co/Zn/Cd efflux system component